jgi:hypothetical protein
MVAVTLTRSLAAGVSGVSGIGEISSMSLLLQATVAKVRAKSAMRENVFFINLSVLLVS